MGTGRPVFFLLLIFEFIAHFLRAAGVEPLKSYGIREAWAPGKNYGDGAGMRP